MRATAFLGAGAVLDLGGPATATLTGAIRQRQQWTGNPKNRQERVPALRLLAEALDRYYRPSTANFEDIFHAIESLWSFCIGMRRETSKEFKPAMGAFAALDKQFAYDPIVLRGALVDIIEVVADHVLTYVNTFQPDGAHRWFSDFWRSATTQCRWDIATLNYDNCIQQSLMLGSWEDGFSELDPALYRFSPLRLRGSAQTRVLQLHGSVFYGFPRFQDPNRFLFEDEHEDLYRFASPADARPTWFGRSNNHAQTGESAIAGPIITGQRKPDKLLAYPYSTYQSVLQSSVLDNPRLLIAGYSFGDYHFNRMLTRLTRQHGANRRVVVIDYAPVSLRGPDWHPDPAVREWPGHETCKAIMRLGRMKLPLEGRYRNPWVSEDECMRVYLEGFEAAVRSHGAEILDFLTK